MSELTKPFENSVCEAANVAWPQRLTCEWGKDNNSESLFNLYYKSSTSKYKQENLHLQYSTIQLVKL
jgi:hypothetical protein